MLRFTTKLTEMHLLTKMMVMMMMWAFMVRTAAQPRCDPLTQYEHNFRCCKMCGPGTSMTSIGTCLEPQCQECGKNEYQDKYTKASKCQLQPYCDPNRNFMAPVHKSNKRSTCMCNEGFHCSTEECITCVPHGTCEPGHGVLSKGNHTHDTVCQKCPKGTYSDEDSWDGVCKKWTECHDGYHIQQSGTEMSDNICEETSRTHVVVIVVVLLVILVLLVAAILYWQCGVKRGDAKGKVKVCVESCLGEKREPLKEATVLITTPTDPIDEESMLPEMLSSQEECFPRTPEENEDELSQEMSKDVRLTDNGNLLMQDNGKAEVVPRQESQPQTFAE